MTDPEFIALVPAKGQSRRVPNKNFRPFADELSMLEIKVEQLKAARNIAEIYISSDADEARAVADRLGVRFLLRDNEHVLDDTPWSEVLTAVLRSAPVPDTTYVAWAPLTSPLFTRYDEAIERLRSDPQIDSVMTVTRLQHFYLNRDFLPLNHQWGVWASYTQKLAPIYQMNCALWLARKGDMIRNRFQVGDAPGYLETDPIEGIDIDTMDEFEMAQFFYRKRFMHAA